MSRRGHGTGEPSDSDHAEPSGHNLRHRGHPQQKGKRKEDGAQPDDTPSGSKKGRSAFEDITNVDNDGQSQLTQQEKEAISRTRAHYRASTSSQGRSEVYDRFAPSREVEKVLSLSGDYVDHGADYIDIDAADTQNHLACKEYVAQVMDCLFQSEKKHRPIISYMNTVQRDIHADMRAILIDWLVEVALEYKLVSDTLFLAVSFIDRFLSVANVQRQQLQLVGVACLLLAAKNEEIYCPLIKDFAYITDNTYTKEEIKDMEKWVWRALRFELTAPTARVFLRRFVKASAADWLLGDIWRPEAEYLAAYITELTLPDFNMLHWVPSMIAAAAVFLARYSCACSVPALRPMPIWNTTLTHYTTYRAEDLRMCAKALLTLYVKMSSRLHNLPAIPEKYAQSKYLCVSTMQPPDRIPDYLFVGNAPVLAPYNTVPQMLPQPQHHLHAW